MQTRVFDIKHYAVHDGPGIRTTFFLMGCPLRCLWCQNPESWDDASVITFTAAKCIGCGKCASTCEKLDARGQLPRSECKLCGACVANCPTGARAFGSRLLSPQDVFETVLDEKIFFEASRGGVTFSGGECLLHPDFVAEAAALLRQNGIHVTADTCGAVPWKNIAHTLPHVNLFLYDIKLMDAKKHRLYTGMDNRLILDNLRKLCDAGADVVIRVPLIPNHTDDEENIRAICAFVRDELGNRVRRVELLPYNKLAGSKYGARTVWSDYSLGEYRLGDAEPQDKETLRRLAAIPKEMGVDSFCESL